jgi:heterodisulfide reductase subunit A-like polyferredoxin/ferredoxin
MMSEISLEIDGREVKVEEGTTVLEAAKSVGIDIPTLCYHPALSPFGACRLCSVEIISDGRSRIVASCSYPVEEGLVVNTKSPDVIETRKAVSELLLARCPNVKVIQDLAREYGVEKPRFRLGDEDEKCILCGLCVRMCEERMGTSVINFVNRGVERKIETPFQGTGDKNLDVCRACGACASVCPTGAITLEDITGKKPVPILSEFEEGLAPRAPIYIPFAQAVPNVPVIDREQCVHFTTGECKTCQAFCAAEAIDFEQEDEIIEVEVGSIIIATGFSLFDPTPIYQYGYGRLDNVVTSLEFERMVNSAGPTGGHILLKDGSEPQSIALIHCVGSRDEQYHEYCSRICCMYSMKLAHLIKEHTSADVYEFYIDIRSFGKGYEEFYNRVLEEETIFIRSKPAEVTDIAETPEEEGKLIVQFEDTLVGKQRRLPVDMVVLSCAIEPQKDTEAVARLFNISRSADGFFLEKHPKLDPVATMTDGIFIAGCCQGPKDIPDTVAQASAAAAESLAMISRGKVEVEAATAVINERLCTGCQLCKAICPYSAISFDEEKGVCQVNEALCKGCGACVGGCPGDVISLSHYTNEQLLAQMEGALT